MYTISDRAEDNLLTTGGETGNETGPELVATDPFFQVLETLPVGCVVPLPLVKLGLLTQHLETVDDAITIDLSADGIESSDTAVVPPETLAAVTWLLVNHGDRLDAATKKRVGRLCDAAGLTRATEHGDGDAAVREAASTSYARDDSFLTAVFTSLHRCQYCGEGFESRKDCARHSEDCAENPDTDESDDGESSSQRSSKNRPAFGKEIRADRGSERVSGRNPHADPERMKDIGLHKGG